MNVNITIDPRLISNYLFLVAILKLLSSLFPNNVHVGGPGTILLVSFIIYVIDYIFECIICKDLWRKVYWQKGLRWATYPGIYCMHLVACVMGFAVASVLIKSFDIFGFAVLIYIVLIVFARIIDRSFRY